MAGVHTGVDDGHHGSGSVGRFPGALEGHPVEGPLVADRAVGSEGHDVGSHLEAGQAVAQGRQGGGPEALDTQRAGGVGGHRHVAPGRRRRLVECRGTEEAGVVERGVPHGQGGAPGRQGAGGGKERAHDGGREGAGQEGREHPGRLGPQGRDGGGQAAHVETSSCSCRLRQPGYLGEARGSTPPRDGCALVGSAATDPVWLRRGGRRASTAFIGSGTAGLKPSDAGDIPPNRKLPPSDPRPVPIRAEDSPPGALRTPASGPHCCCGSPHLTSVVPHCCRLPPAHEPAGRSSGRPAEPGPGSFCSSAGWRPMNGGHPGGIHDRTE